MERMESPSSPSGRMKVSGVYAILGPRGVYVGESADCWGRRSLGLAASLGLECGIVRETPAASRLERIRAEAAVAEIFHERGMTIVSEYLGCTGRPYARGDRSWRHNQRRLARTGAK